MPDIDPTTLAAREVYHLMTSLVVPRPIAWVSSLSPSGVANVAPYSYFNMVSHDPPIVHFTSAGPKDTLHNVREGGEFVVNIVSEHVHSAMNLTAADFPADEDEFDWAGLTPTASTVVKPPRVGEAKAALECRLHREITVGTGTMVFGEVVYLHVAAEVWRDGRVDPELLRPVGRLSGSMYATMGTFVKMPRPAWEDVRAARERG